MSTELLKAYEPKEIERRIYDFWMQGGYFHAEPDPEKKPYTIVIPPPSMVSGRVVASSIKPEPSARG